MEQQPKNIFKNYLRQAIAQQAKIRSI
jgi:hypothetical protein